MTFSQDERFVLASGSLVNSVTVLEQLKGIIDAIVVSMGGQTSAQQRNQGAGSGL